MHFSFNKAPSSQTLSNALDTCQKTYLTSNYGLHQMLYKFQELLKGIDVHMNPLV